VVALGVEVGRLQLEDDVVLAWRGDRDPEEDVAVSSAKVPLTVFEQPRVAVFEQPRVAVFEQDLHLVTSATGLARCVGAAGVTFGG
jgi:hypothetical protein